MHDRIKPVVAGDGAVTAAPGVRIQPDGLDGQGFRLSPLLKLL